MAKKSIAHYFLLGGIIASLSIGFFCVVFKPSWAQVPSQSLNFGLGLVSRGWFQTEGGDVHADGASGTVTDYIPQTVPAARAYVSIVGNSIVPGNVSQGSTAPPHFGLVDNYAWSSPQGWLALGNNYISSGGTKYDYNYYLNKIASLGITTTNCETAVGSGILDNTKVQNGVSCKVNNAISSINAPISMVAAPIAAWKMDEASGTTVADSSGNNNNATANAPTIVAGQTGYVNARSFNGTSDVITIATNNLLQPLTSMTISAWFKTSGNGVIIGYQGHPIPLTVEDVGWTCALYVGTDGKLRGQFGLNTGAATPITSTGVVNNGAWHHAELVGSVNTQSLYLDNVLVGTLAGTISAPGQIYNQIGAGYSHWWPASNNTNFYFNGQIDDVRFYNYARSTAQIQTDWNNPTPASLPVASVILVNGNLTINQKISAPVSSFIGFISSGNITVAASVASNAPVVTPNSPDLQGMFISSGQFITGTAGAQADANQLVIKGVVTAWGGITFNRSLTSPNNDTYPAEYIIYDPSFVRFAPNFFTRSNIQWLQVAP